MFRLYASDSSSGDDVLLGTWLEYAAVASGVTSVSEGNEIGSLDSLYEITYNWNGGGLSSDATARGSYTRQNGAILPTEAQVTKTGYTFGGWYGNASFSGSEVTEIEAGSTGNKTFWAKWSAVTYTISYELNDGGWAGGYTAEESYTVESEVTLPTESNIAKDGFLFKGWYESSDFSTSEVTQIAAGETGDRTFYAKWKVNAIYVSESGSDTDGDGTSEKPFATLARAITKINADNLPDRDWSICIIGRVKGTTTISSLAAASLTITGQTGSGTDILDGESAGCVINIESYSLTVTLKNITVTNGKSVNGGGLFFSGGVLNIEDGTVISGNEATNAGGGVYNSGPVIMSGGEISGNTVAESAGGRDFSGGGVCCSGAFTMTGGKISGNEAKCGGGVYIKYAFTMTGGTISGNTATDGTAAPKGGGVYNRGTFTMSGGTISGNTVISENNWVEYGGGVYNDGSMFMYGNAVIGDSTKTEAATYSAYSNIAGQGGGIYNKGALYLGYSDAGTQKLLTGGVYYNYASMSASGGGIYNSGTAFSFASGTVGYNGSDMSGGGISGNTAKYGGVYNNGTFTMSGSALVASDNDVYLANGKYITVSGTLTATAPVATITPQSYSSSYSSGTQVLAESTSGLVSANYDKFAVTQPESGAWTIDSAGLLKEE